MTPDTALNHEWRLRDALPAVDMDPSRGAYAVTNASGEFSLTGTFTGSDVFHAQKEGYAGQTRAVESGLAFVLTSRR
jgi:hypothetical protein